MPPDTQRSSRTESGSSAADADHVTTPVTAGAPTWYLNARPLAACCDHVEYAIDCPADCGREAIAWRSRPGERAGGWGCACGARGQLWQLLPGVAA